MAEYDTQRNYTSMCGHDNDSTLSRDARLNVIPSPATRDMTRRVIFKNKNRRAFAAYPQCGYTNKETADEKQRPHTIYERYRTIIWQVFSV